jgi:hypothetical protein
MTNKPDESSENELNETEAEELDEIKRLTVEIMEIVMTALKERDYSLNNPDCRHTMAAFAIAPAIAATHLIAIQETTMQDGSIEMAQGILDQTMNFMKDELKRISAEMKMVASGVRQGATETLQ